MYPKLNDPQPANVIQMNIHAHTASQRPQAPQKEQQQFQMLKNEAANNYLENQLKNNAQAQGQTVDNRLLQNRQIDVLKTYYQIKNPIQRNANKVVIDLNLDLLDIPIRMYLPFVSRALLRTIVPLFLADGLRSRGLSSLPSSSPPFLLSLSALSLSPLRCLATWTGTFRTRSRC